MEALSSGSSEPASVPLRTLMIVPGVRDAFLFVKELANQGRVWRAEMIYNERDGDYVVIAEHERRAHG